jgi:hypothetical protein
MLPYSTSHVRLLGYAVDTGLYVVEKSISEAIGPAFIERSGLVHLILRLFKEARTHFRSRSRIRENTSEARLVLTSPRR